MTLPMLSTVVSVPHLQVFPGTLCVVSSEALKILSAGALSAMVWPAHTLRTFTENIVDVVDCSPRAPVAVAESSGSESESESETENGDGVCREPVVFGDAFVAGAGVRVVRIIPAKIYHTLARAMPLLGPVLRRTEVGCLFIDCESVASCASMARERVFPISPHFLWEGAEARFVADAVLAVVPSDWTIVCVGPARGLGIGPPALCHDPDCAVARLGFGVVADGIVRQARFVCPNGHPQHLECALWVDGAPRCKKC